MVAMALKANQNFGPIIGTLASHVAHETNESKRRRY